MRTMQSQIVWCTRMQKSLAALVGAMLLTFFFFSYRPETARLAELKSTIASREQELKANRIAAAARNEIAARNERLRLELDRIKKPSKQKELADLIKELSLFGQHASLKKFETITGMPQRGDLYNEYPLSLKFEGDFVNIFNFLRSTDEMHRLTRIRSVSLKSKDISGTKVQATVALNIYYSAE
jgi:Tfp pilus assembly protein PilO